MSGKKTDAQKIVNEFCIIMHQKFSTAFPIEQCKFKNKNETVHGREADIKYANVAYPVIIAGKEKENDDDAPEFKVIYAIPYTCGNFSKSGDKIVKSDRLYAWAAYNNPNHEYNDHHYNGIHNDHDTVHAWIDAPIPVPASIYNLVECRADKEKPEWRDR